MSDFLTARRNMVDCQVRPSDVTDQRIITAMLAVPRDAFVPESKRALAYLDLDLDVSDRGNPPRCLLKPALVARMMQAAGIKSTDSVLVVGCATGYTAALAARIAARVTATESDAALAAKAASILKGLGLGDIAVVEAAAGAGAPDTAPYDVILMEGASEIIPEQLYRQLAENGRLVGISAIGRPQRAMIVTRSYDDFGDRPLFDASAPVLPGLERPAEFVF
ncbi:MAG TPA: methyltransferase domain-containing protein [Nitrobacter sp.]|jgi:protein-L-isoaspartate(D-aspartate) O-methyltransferase|nr:methyltransferase domain-containing protein [Nitrobacter sp.]